MRRTRSAKGKSRVAVGQEHRQTRLNLVAAEGIHPKFTAQPRMPTQLLRNAVDRRETETGIRRYGVESWPDI